MTVRKTWTVRKTCPFNLLVTGHTRAGKTDFIHTLLETVKIVKFTAISSDQSNGNEQAPNYSPPPKLFPDEVTCPTALACAIECHPDPESSDKISLGLIDSPGLSIPSGLNRAPQTSIDALEK
jgi:septin family protein